MKKGNLIINNNEFLKQYLTQGYFKTKFLDTFQVNQLKEIFQNNFSIKELPDIHDTIANTPTEIIKKVNREINAICEPFLQQVLSNFKIVGSIYFVKKSGENSSLGLHLDPTLTTEEYNNFGVWIPLIDVDEDTGQMCLLPYSQNYLPPYFTPSMPNPYLEFAKDISKKMHCIPMKSGEALVFNNSIVHQTPKNISGKTRVAVVIKIIDANAPVATVFYDESALKNKKVSVYVQEDDFFISEKYKSISPTETSQFLFYVKNLPKKLSLKDIKR